MKSITYFMFVHSSEDGKLWCEFPDLDCCMTDGDNLNDLMKNAADCLESYMIGVHEMGKNMPGPSDAEALQAKAATCETPVAFVVPVTGYLPAPPARINVTSTAAKIDEITTFAKKTGRTRSELMVNATLEYIRSNA